MEQISTDLLVVGASLSGLSLAIQAKEAGVDRVLVIEPGDRVGAAEVIGQHALSVEFRTPVTSLSIDASGRVLVGAERLTVAADLVAVASRPVRASRPLAFPVPPSLTDRIHLIPPAINFRESDVLVVGSGEEAAEYAWWLAGQEAGLVLAFGGADLEVLSRLARRQLFRLEAERRATILWNSQPEAIEEVAGFPMVYFGDRRTPDLQFDHVVFRQPDPSGETDLD
ncbi:MAG: hypothetical protein M3488_01370, partial [Actinomycetota bacterium]|nr:hypothetical protein [Actinomycetota bacterium]